LHSTVGSIFLSFSNSPSINIVLTLKPALLYTCRTQSKCLARLLAILTGTCSVVMNLICQDIVNRKAVPSTKNTSATIVINLLVSTREQGTAMWSATTGAGVLQTVFPLMLAKSGPNIARALLMSVVVIGQFVIRFPLTIPL
jgi:hypothetical protein